MSRGVDSRSNAINFNNKTYTNPYTTFDFLRNLYARERLCTPLFLSPFYSIRQQFHDISCGTEKISKINHKIQHHTHIQNDTR